MSCGTVSLPRRARLQDFALSSALESLNLPVVSLRNITKNRNFHFVLAPWQPHAKPSITNQSNDVKRELADPYLKAHDTHDPTSHTSE